MNEYAKVYKILSKNDVGETNSHQSGIAIPKVVAKTEVFPQLGKEIKNPREEIYFFDQNNKPWIFQYIYYNDFFFDKPNKNGHNEFRLTCVKKYIQENGIKSGDSIWFALDKDGVRHIGFNKSNQQNKEEKVLIKLTKNWKYIKF